MAQKGERCTRRMSQDASLEGSARRACSRPSFEQTLAALKPGIVKLQQQHADGSLPLLRIVDERQDITDAADALSRLCEGADTLIFFGTGGSSLGGQTLAQLAGWNIPGAADAAQRGRPRTRFYDNLDPVTLERSLAALDLETARFIVISKSGGTPETLTQALAALQAVRAKGLGDRLASMFLGVTEAPRPGVRNGLRDLFSGFGIPLLEHHSGIGGRFSALTNVGLLAAMSRGLDPLAIRRGAKRVMQSVLDADDAATSAPALGAAVVMGLTQHRGIRVQVVMPYADRLGRLADWYVQLWAESLGKDGKGSTPLGALGPVDQHSQLQLFQDGPREHLVTFVSTETAGQGPRIDADLAAKAGFSDMAGRHVGDLVAAQVVAVPEALMQAGRPVRLIHMPKLDETAIGAVMMHFMLETILSGHLLGVDPFDQPAVELAKRLTRERLAKR